MDQVVEILGCGRQGPVYTAYSIPWLLMAWPCKVPGHQQQWYWSRYLKIFWLYHILICIMYGYVYFRTNTSDVCEGHGQCMCGVCECAAINSGHPSQRYSGKFCECDDFSCDYYDNKICSGKCGSKFYHLGCRIRIIIIIIIIVIVIVIVISL